MRRPAQLVSSRYCQSSELAQARPIKSLDEAASGQDHQYRNERESIARKDVKESDAERIRCGDGVKEPQAAPGTRGERCTQRRYSEERAKIKRPEDPQEPGPFRVDILALRVRYFCGIE